MNPMERALLAIQHKEPDRVPLFELSIAPRVSSKILGRIPIYSNEPLILDMRSRGIPRIEIERKIVQDIIDLFYKKLEHDVIHCISESGFGAALPGIYKGYGTSLALNSKAKVVKAGENMWQIDGRFFRYLPETNLLVDVAPVSNTSEEVEMYINDHWNDLGELSDEELYLEKQIVKELGDEALIAGYVGELGAFHKWEINHILKWVHTHPTLVEKFVNFDSRCMVKVAEAKIDMGVSVCIIDCDWAYDRGPFVSPALFRRIWMPALKRVVEAIHRRGAFAVCHADGNMNLLLEDMVNCGIDGIHSLQPSAGMDIGSVKRRYGDRISLWGNIDLAYPLTFGTVEETVKATVECIRAASLGGGHILSTSNAVSQTTKYENYVAMMETAKKYGRYPISIS